MTNNEKLEHFTTMIIGDASSLSDKILSDIKLERDSAIRSAQDEYLTEIYAYIKSEVAKIQIEEGQRVSKKVLECKRTLYARRAEIEASISDELRSRIIEYAGTQDYLTRLQSACTDADRLLAGAPCVVAMRSCDLQHEGKLRPLFHGSVSFEEGDVALGGLVITSKERHLRVDHTLDTAYQEKAGHLAELLQLSFSE